LKIRRRFYAVTRPEIRAKTKPHHRSILIQRYFTAKTQGTQRTAKMQRQISSGITRNVHRTLRSITVFPNTRGKSNSIFRFRCGPGTRPHLNHFLIAASTSEKVTYRSLRDECALPMEREPRSKYADSNWSYCFCD
jgi:hypothetical protein